MLKTAFKDDTISGRQTYEWFRYFQWYFQTSIDDFECSGRPPRR